MFKSASLLLLTLAAAAGRAEAGRVLQNAAFDSAVASFFNTTLPAFFNASNATAPCVPLLDANCTMPLDMPGLIIGFVQHALQAAPPATPDGPEVDHAARTKADIALFANMVNGVGEAMLAKALAKQNTSALAQLSANAASLAAMQATLAEVASTANGALNTARGAQTAAAQAASSAVAALSLASVQAQPVVVAQPPPPPPPARRPGLFAFSGPSSSDAGAPGLAPARAPAPAAGAATTMQPTDTAAHSGARGGVVAGVAAAAALIALYI